MSRTPVHPLLFILSRCFGVDFDEADVREMEKQLGPLRGWSSIVRFGLQSAAFSLLGLWIAANGFARFFPIVVGLLILIAAYDIFRK